MDKLSHYRSAVKQVLSQHAAYVPSHGQIETLPVCDERNDNYLLLDIGWIVQGASMPLCSMYV